VTVERPPVPDPEPDRRWRLVVISLVPIVLIAALLGFGLGRNPRATPQVVVGRRAPGFALTDLRTGKVVRLSEFEGHPVVLNFWASWCVDCTVEHPSLVAAWQQFGDQGTVFLSVLYQDTAANARGFLDELPAVSGSGWPNLLDPGGRTALNYGVTGVPETVFIGRDGRIAAKNPMVTSYDLLQREIRRMLGASA
jgi:cytochrome c biogenesis protein CcmG/thiol:disulfide interchange protein DsbE